MALFTNTDAGNWPEVKAVLADKVLLDFSSMSGSPAIELSSLQIIDAWKGLLPGFDKTDHQITAIRIHQDGNRAEATYHGNADHYLGNKTWTVEADYETELIQQGDTWLITRHKLNLISQTGDLNLPAEAAEAVKQKIAKQ